MAAKRADSKSGGGDDDEAIKKLRAKLQAVAPKRTSGRPLRRISNAHRAQLGSRAGRRRRWSSLMDSRTWLASEFCCSQNSSSSSAVAAQKPPTVRPAVKLANTRSRRARASERENGETSAAGHAFHFNALKLTHLAAARSSSAQLAGLLWWPKLTCPLPARTGHESRLAGPWASQWQASGRAGSQHKSRKEA